MESTKRASRVEEGKNKADNIDVGTYQLQAFYLNIILLNKDEVVKNKATERVGNNIFGKAAAFTANRLVSNEKILEGIVEKLMNGITSAITTMGISASQEKVFQKGAFVVIRLQISEVDKIKLLRKAKGDEFSASFEVLLHSLNMLGLDAANSQIDKKMKDHIQEGMMSRFEEVIPQKLAENGVNVDVECVPSEKEAEYFFKVHKYL
mmetsp:Transcript_988/g.1646  ORF Transcript_988/g.1646 Transcript_988/m.1646 type:complete len:207 (+) Transcript_988:105-725(+)|eukprot:CAMPEP_0174972002 /NCGR_PEP_ID=MMETSP0004_2-20121128/10365_1 /TAXON_ID=420556 /ORGANISM="Ochromonas sp., Strain CCMP1393" /LENGTH=206 /DNA_ID=CAMNT_0016222133 /DNA_START=95 /DNA_END=715 /DNA_ORIENTATION=-